MIIDTRPLWQQHLPLDVAPLIPFRVFRPIERCYTANARCWRGVARLRPNERRCRDTDGLKCDE